MGWQPVAAVQYTFTHKQYIEQHNETEYTEWNIHNNNDTQLTKLSIQFTKIVDPCQNFIYSWMLSKCVLSVSGQHVLIDVVNNKWLSVIGV